MLRGLALNVVSNWANALVAGVLGLLVTPYLIAGLKDPAGGNTAYGVMIFIVSLSAYFGLLDLGFYQGVVQFFTRYRTQGRSTEYNRVVSSAVVTLTLVAAVAIVAAIGLAWRFPSFIEIGWLTAGEVRLAFLLASLAVIARLPLQMFAAVIVGCNRFEIWNALTIAGRLITAAGVLWVLAVGAGLVAVVAVTAVGSLVGPVGHVWAAFRVEPGLRIRARLFDRAALREIMSYGKWMLGSHLYDLYLANIDLIVVPLLFGSEALAVYGVAVSLVTQAQIGVQGYTWALTPSAIAADARQDVAGMQSVLVKSTRIGLILGGGIALGAAFWGQLFLLLWLQDPSFLWAAEYVSAATVLTIVAADRIFVQGIAGPQQVLIGTRRVRELCVIKVVQGVFSVLVAYTLGRRFGILAVPWALLASSLVGRAALAGLACRLANLPFLRFVRLAVVPALVTLLASAAVGLALVRTWPASGWLGLAVECAVFVMLSAVVALRVGLTVSERSSLIGALRARLSRG